MIGIDYLEALLRLTKPPYVCPICYGAGEIGWYDRFGEPQVQKCSLCGGTGMVGTEEMKKFIESRSYKSPPPQEEAGEEEEDDIVF